MSHRPRKRFGQNFLRDQSVIERIVDYINPKSGEHLVEIGPGQGALTASLLSRIDSLDAIELDRDLVQPLIDQFDQFGATKDLRIHQADALKFDFEELRSDAEKLRLVGNLPYNISTPLLFHLIDQAEVIQDMHFMLQKEVVDRMAAGPGSKTYGRLSVMLQISCEVTPLFDISPEAFYPPPKVQSTVVRLVPLKSPLVSAEAMPTFAALVTAAFGQRRKTLRNNLKHLIDEAEIAAVGIDPAARSETLSPQQFVALHRRHSSKVSAK